MTVCVFTTSLGSQWFYPVIDPYRTAGDGPYHYAYVFAWDAVEITVTRSFPQDRHTMSVELSSSLPETKQIQAFNLFRDTSLDHIDSHPGGAVASMTIMKRMPGQSCGAHTDTLVLARATPFGPKAMYTFPSDDLWDFWGGCTVRFTWVSDTGWGGTPWGPSGAQTPAPSYPVVRLPDKTLMRNAAGTGVSVVFGGTDFPADPSYLRTLDTGGYLRMLDTGADTLQVPVAPDKRNLLGMSDPRNQLLLGGAIPFTPLPAIPADFTLVREWNRPEVFVVFGGAKFWIPDPPTLMDLGFDWSMVRVIPAGGTSKLRTIPIDGTLIMEQHPQQVFLVDNQQLRFASQAARDARCLPSRHVRVVPDTSLSALPRGPDLT